MCFSYQCGREYHVGCLKEHAMADLTVIFLTLKHPNEFVAESWHYINT
jgi:hypothetical protein